MPPVTVAPATKGLARRFAKGAATGTSPTKPSRIGATATWAATVARRARPTTVRPPPDPTRSPRVAATDNAKPRSWANRGATSRLAATAMPRMLRPVRTIPSRLVTRRRPAITEARTTDGSHRVTVANRTSPATPTAQRIRGWIARGSVTTHHPTRNNATFEPETATKWDKPARRRSSTTTRSTALVSPMRNPASSGPPGGAADSTTSRTRARIASAAPASPDGGPNTATRRTETDPANGRPREVVVDGIRRPDASMAVPIASGRPSSTERRSSGPLHGMPSRVSGSNTAYQPVPGDGRGEPSVAR
jgi:hypothetical protein